MATLIVFFILSIAFSFLCSIWEAVLLSINPSYVETIKEDSPWLANTLQEFKDNIDQPLSAILTLNTIAHTVGAIGVGGAAAALWSDSPPYEILGFNLSIEALVAVLMTLAILIFSEIIPKTIGATYWRGLTNFTVRSVKGIIWVLFPLVWASQQITKLFKGGDLHGSVLSRTDFTAMADIGAREGVIQQSEYRIFKNLMMFDSIRAKDIMTPRTVMTHADGNLVIKDFYENNKNLRFSRIPIHSGQVDHMIGYILKDDLYQNLIEGTGKSTLLDLKREFVVVPEAENIGKIFEKLIEKKEQIALVVDEYGGVAGIVTTEDIIETLFGLEIMDEVDATPDMQLLAREQWKKRAAKLGLNTDEV